MRGGIHRCRVRKQPGTSKEECTHAHACTAPQARMVSCKCSGKFRLPSRFNLSCPILTAAVVPSVNHWATFFFFCRKTEFLYSRLKKEKGEDIINNLWHLFAIKWQNLCNSAVHGEANGGLLSKELSGIFYFFDWIMHAAVQDGQRLIHKDWDLRLQWTARPFLSWKINQSDI